MKKLMRTILGLTLALSLCVGVSAAAFGAEKSSDNVSLDDILGLLSSLSTEEIEEEIADEPIVEEIAEGSSMSLGDVTFVLPENMESVGENEEGALMYMSVPAMDTVVMMSLIDNEENIDLTDEMIQDAFKEMLAGEGSEVTNFAVVTVEGYPALWIESTMDVGSNVSGSGSIVVDLGGTIYVASLTSFADQYLDDFLPFVNSIEIASADGETDLSAALGDISVPDVTTPAPVATAPAAAPADAIDATAMDEIVLIDDDLCKVTIKKFEIPEDDNWYGFTAKVFVENKSADLNIWAHMENVALNGYVIDPYWGQDVAAGHKSNSDMTFSLKDLEANGITDISELSFRLEISDDDTYDELESAEFTILPFGKDVPPQPAPVFGDDALFLVDNDDFCMIITGEPVWSDYYLSLPVFIENRTDKNIRFSTYGASAINGYEISPSMYAVIPAGKMLNTEMSWSIEELEDNDIESIEDVELDLTVSDDDDWYADDIYQDMIYFELN